MVKIGNVMLAFDEGKWFDVPATAGAFRLKIKPVLPGERYKYNREIRQMKEGDLEKIVRLVHSLASAKVVDWDSLQDAKGEPLVFSEVLLKDETFASVLLGLEVTEVEGDVSQRTPVANWLMKQILSPDAFVEEATESFLANT